MNEIEKVREEIDIAGITLCHALFAYDDSLISPEVMDCYRDTFASDILAIDALKVVEVDAELPKFVCEINPCDGQCHDCPEWAYEQAQEEMKEDGWEKTVKV